MAVVAETKEFIAAVDTTGIRDEADGSTSGIVALFYVEPFTAEGRDWSELAGRVSFKCKTQQSKTLVLYAVNKAGEVHLTPVKEAIYNDVPEGSVMDHAGGYICNVPHPATTQE